MRILLLALTLLATALAVDRTKFRRCDQASFCRRHRGREPSDHLALVHAEMSEQHAFVGTVTGSEGPLSFEMIFYASGAVRMRVNERDTPRWEAGDLVDPSMETTTPRRLEPGSPEAPEAVRDLTSEQGAVFAFADASVVAVRYQPISVELFVNGEPAIRAGSRNLFHFEHRITRAGNAAGTVDEQADRHKGKVVVDYGEDGKAIYEDGTVEEVGEVETENVAAAEDSNGLWEEKFGTHSDSKPFGPMAISMDIDFPGSQHLYGLAEHASSMALKTTTGEGADYSEPYRLYNLDVFEYELDNPMALYGGIPYIVSHTSKQTVGALWLNPSETFVDISRTSTDSQTHWISESGIVDLFMFPGPSVRSLYTQYSQATGFAPLPPLFSLAYHQCRWNYRDDADCRKVEENFESHNFPYDVLWLDIEHTRGKRYFTWDSHLFPDPTGLQEHLASHGRRMVTITDPHLLRDNNYAQHKEATAKGVYVKDKTGNKDYDGWCWPGSSSYVDFTNPVARDFWSDRYLYENYEGSTPNLFTWIDMQEPSVFNGPEVTMPKDVRNMDGIEHREWHSLYGMYMQAATSEGLIRRNADRNSRPFVLARSFFAGSQKYGAIWTGDNTADWGHLAISTPMLLSIGASGLPFAGADVGGFFGDPSTELLTRWYQVGAYQPFFRAHAHHDSKRREPWIPGEPHTSRLRDAVMARYRNLPLWYTLFEESSRTGLPAMRPIWMEFPQEEAFFATDDAFMVGSSLLVKPVTEAGVATAHVRFPGQQPWYDVDTFATFPGGSEATVDAPIDKIPVFQQGGTIVPQKRRLRRSSALMVRDPFTLVVVLDSNGQATGELYDDDQETFDYTRGEFIHRRFTFSNGALTNAAVRETDYNPTNMIERVIVAGLTKQPSIVAVGSAELTFVYEDGVLTIRKPNVKVGQNWSMTIQ